MTADLVAELRRRGLTDVDDSVLARALYSSDASLYRVVPQVVARPRHPDEIVAALDAARALGVPLTMRGAGTSIAGNAVGPGIVVDTARHLNRVLSLDPESRTAVVQPGVVHASLTREALAHGLRFGPDPSTHTRCTIGGMIGNNACGSRALGYGRTADNVAGMKVAFGTGEVAEVGGSALRRSRQALARPRQPPERELASLVDDHLAHVRTSFGRFSRQVSGYSFEHLLPENGRRHGPVPGRLGGDARARARGDGRAGPRRPRSSAPGPGLPVDGRGGRCGAGGARSTGSGHGRAGRGLRGAGLPDRRPGPGPRPRRAGPAARLRMALRRGRRAPTPPTAVESIVREAGALDRRLVTDPAEAAALWRIREDGAGLAARSLDRPAYSGWEDAAVPPDRLGEWLREFDDLLREHGLDGVPYGHFGDGCVHVRIDFEFDDGGRRFRDFLVAGARGPEALRRLAVRASTVTGGPARSCCR